MANRHRVQRASLAAGLLLACATLSCMLTACEDRREPVKPKVMQVASPAR